MGTEAKREGEASMWEGGREDKAGDGTDGQGKTRTIECIHRSGETEAICSLDRSQ